MVLDNFEHLLAAAPAVTGLLAACPNLAVLVTSRAALRVSGEQIYEVLPLATPDLATLRMPPCQQVSDGLLANDAVALFVARARAVRPDFALTPANAAAVATVCARLDGLPALELAAARVELLSAQDLQARLQRRLELLRLALRPPARQQTPGPPWTGATTCWMRPSSGCWPSWRCPPGCRWRPPRPSATPTATLTRRSWTP